jgi:hypothetical protein
MKAGYPRKSNGRDVSWRYIFISIANRDRRWGEKGGSGRARGGCWVNSEDAIKAYEAVVR